MRRYMSWYIHVVILALRVLTLQVRIVQNWTLYRGAPFIICSSRETELCGFPVYKGDNIFLNNEMSARTLEVLLLIR